jgi:hypothetical protein
VFAGFGAAPAQLRQEVVPHPGEGQLQVVITERDDELAPLRLNELAQRVPDGNKRLVLDDAVELVGGAGGVKVPGVGLGKEIDQVAVDDQSLVGPLRLKQLRHQAGECLSLVEDLPCFAFPAEVEVGNHMDFFVRLKGTHR